MGRDLFKRCELERLAEKYARLVMIKPGYRPENMPDLVLDREWAAARQDQRDQISRCIRDMARVLLIKARYSRKIVYRNIP